MPPMTSYDIKSYHMITTFWHLHNREISPENLFLPEWYQKGIHSVLDILDYNDKVRSLTNLQSTYRFTETNFLNHLRVKCCTSKFLLRTGYKNLHVARPYIPNHVRILFHNQKGASIFYKFVNEQRENKHIMKHKWNRDLNVIIDNITWKNIFIHTFNMHDNDLIWFQIKLIYRILGTKVYQNKIGLSEQFMCSFCQNQAETLIHMFTECIKTQEIWKSLEMHIYQKTQKRVIFPKLTILFGYLIHDQNNEPLNMIILLTKVYIFKCSQNNAPLNLNALKSKLKKHYIERKLLARLNNQEESFIKKWEIWSHMIDSE